MSFFRYNLFATFYFPDNWIDIIYNINYIILYINVLGDISFFSLNLKRTAIGSILKERETLIGTERYEVSNDL